MIAISSSYKMLFLELCKQVSLAITSVSASLLVQCRALSTPKKRKGMRLKQHPSSQVKQKSSHEQVSWWCEVLCFLVKNKTTSDRF